MNVHVPKGQILIGVGGQQSAVDGPAVDWRGSDVPKGQI